MRQSQGEEGGRSGLAFVRIGLCNSKTKPKKGGREGRGRSGEGRVVVQIKDFCSKSIKPAN